MDRVRLGAETPGLDPRRATVGRPYRPAVPVDGHPVGSAPGSPLNGELCPIADDAIGIGAGVDRLNVLGLGMASWHRQPQDNRCSKPFWKSRHRHGNAPWHGRPALFCAPWPPVTTGSNSPV